MDSNLTKKLRKKENEKDVRIVLKRINAIEDQISMCSGLIAKLSFNNPVTTFQLLIDNNVIAFDNLMSATVACLEHVNCFGFDVLLYCLLNRAGQTSKIDEKVCEKKKKEELILKSNTCLGIVPAAMAGLPLSLHGAFSAQLLFEN